MRQIKDILTLENNEVELSQRSLEIDTNHQAKEMREIVTALKQTLNAHEDIVALAAPQIGYQRRIFCIKFKEEIKTFINPIICEAKGLTLSRETSIVEPGVEYIRPRNIDVTFMYQRPTGQSQSRQLVGLAAIIFQQMMDALDGILLCDIGLEIIDGWDDATDEERQEVVEAYLDSLDLRTKAINEDIQNDPELKQISDGIDFMESVWTGKTTLGHEEDMVDPPVEQEQEKEDVRDN